MTTSPGEPLAGDIQGFQRHALGQLEARGVVAGD